MTKRIILSLAMIALVIAGVTSATVAYFSDTVEVTGVTVAMGTADLELNTESPNKPDDYEDGPVNLALNVGGLYPGLSIDGDVWLRNVSLSAISLRPYVRLFAQGDWSALKNKIQIRITDKGRDGNGTYSWGWQDLEWWNSEPRPVSDANGIAPEINPDGTPNPNGTANSHQYLIEARVKSDAGNEIQGKSLTNVRWEIVGEQVPTP